MSQKLQNITLQQMFKVPAFGPNTRPMRSTPLINRIVNDCLQHVCPAVNEALPQLVDASITLPVHELLQHSKDLVIYGVEVHTVGRLQVGCYEGWRLTTKQLHCITCMVCWRGTLSC